ncbi:MAG TPA: NADH-quinone oxidoreductase subunit N [Planctomycetota bacterium]|nr:NADH-quinone oxidoreductase subunit N [Planctomycetota bacterium]
MSDATSLTHDMMQAAEQLTPVASLLGGAMIIIMLDLRKNMNVRAFLPFVAILAILMAVGSLWSQLAVVPQNGFVAAAGSLRMDGFSLWASIIIAIGAGLSILAVSGREGEAAPAAPGIARRLPPPAEHYALLLTATAGGMLQSMANDLLTALVALETLSIPTYVLCASDPRRQTSAEAGLKYFMMGAFSSGVLIFGIVFFYGATGSLSLSPEKWLTFDPYYATLFQVQSHMDKGHEVGSMLGASPFFFYAAIALMLVGFVFKVGGVPFQQWVPDVYTGAPTPVTSFMATVIKAAAFAFLVRVAATVFSTAQLDQISTQIVELNQIRNRMGGVLQPSQEAHLRTLELTRQNLYDLITCWQNVLWILSAATMILGNTVALVQTNVKRMLAYSAIAHSGYLLMGVVAVVNQSTDHASTDHVMLGVAFYLLSYVLAAAGAFGVIGLLRKSGRELNTLDDFRGLAKERPSTALAMTLFMLSMAGFPPLGGFFGKYLVFRATIDAGFGKLAVLAIVTSIVSVFYYVGVVVVMYMKQPPGLEPDPFAPLDEHGHPIDPPTQISDPMAEPAWGSTVLVALCGLGIVVLGVFAQKFLDHMSSM